jgi:hypothetical protein
MTQTDGKFARPGDCQHVTITDAMLVERELQYRQSWGNADPLKCPDCNEWLYPDGDPEDDGVVYVGEPYGAGG